MEEVGQHMGIRNKEFTSYIMCLGCNGAVSPLMKWDQNGYWGRGSDGVASGMQYSKGWIYPSCVNPIASLSYTNMDCTALYWLYCQSRFWVEHNWTLAILNNNSEDELNSLISWSDLNSDKKPKLSLLDLEDEVINISPPPCLLSSPSLRGNKAK